MAIIKDGNISSGVRYFNTISLLSGTSVNSIVTDLTASSITDNQIATALSIKDLVDNKESFDNLDVDNININGNTISSTDTNGDINITPDGDGDINLTTVAGRTKISRLLGTWSSEQSYTNIRENWTESTTIQATTDLCINVYKFFYDYRGGSGTTSSFTVNIYTDSNATPTTLLASLNLAEHYSLTTTDRTMYMPMTVLVKKDDYYKIEIVNATTNSDIDTTAYWRTMDIGV